MLGGGGRGVQLGGPRGHAAVRGGSDPSLGRGLHLDCGAGEDGWVREWGEGEQGWTSTQLMSTWYVLAQICAMGTVCCHGSPGTLVHCFSVVQA